MRTGGKSGSSVILLRSVSAALRHAAAFYPLFVIGLAEITLEETLESLAVTGLVTSHLISHIASLVT